MCEIEMALSGSGGNSSKIMAILKVFCGGGTLNRFDAEHHHDHCLHSTVASLQALGLVIARRWESVPCLRGRAQVRCKRYWLDPAPDNIATAHALLVAWGTP